MSIGCTRTKPRLRMLLTALLCLHRFQFEVSASSSTLSKNNNGWKRQILAFASSSSKDASRGRSNPIIPPPPPISMPVWSLAVPSVPGNDDVTTSMNIVTFAVPVSVAPPKLWAVSLYYGTRTKDSFCDYFQQGVLQLLRPHQKHLVPLLGKRSGYEEGYSKQNACADIGFEWVSCGNTTENHTSIDKNINELHLLPSCASYIHLKIKETFPAGDHVVALCEVVNTGVWDETLKKVVWLNGGNDTSNAPALDHDTALYTGLLRKEKII